MTALQRQIQATDKEIDALVYELCNRFPPDFMFSLTREEIARMSQIVISPDLQSRADLKFSKSVLAFTEQGVAMLSSVLRSPRAVLVNIEIMRAFVRLRRMLADNVDLARRLDDLERKYDVQFKVVFDALRQLMQKPKPEPEHRKIGFQVREPFVAPYRASGGEFAGKGRIDFHQAENEPARRTDAGSAQATPQSQDRH